MMHWILAAVLPATAMAAILDFKPQGFEVRAGDRLIVRGYDGDIKFVATKGNQMVVKVRQETSESVSGGVRSSMDEWNLALQRTGSGIEMIVQSPPGKDVWRQLLATGGVPKYMVEIQSPAVPADVTWRNGRMTFENWSADIRVGMQDGQAVVNGATGDVKIVGQDCEIRVKGRSGRVDVESYSGKIYLDDIKGAIGVENFAGETSVNRSEGNLDFKSYRAPLSVAGGKGRVEFETIRGPIKVTGFSGDLKGRSDEAPVTAKVSSAGEVRISTQSGPVTLDLPNSAAMVSAASVEGGISGPPHLKSEQMAGQRVMRGRLRGSTEGVVVVRTQSGPVRIR